MDALQKAEIIEDDRQYMICESRSIEQQSQIDLREAMGALDPTDIQAFIYWNINEICDHFEVHRELVFTSRAKMNAEWMILTIVFFLKNTLFFRIENCEHCSKRCVIYFQILQILHRFGR